MMSEDFFITGLPIETEVGQCHFLKVRDYSYYLNDLSVLSLSKDNLIYQYHKLNKNNELDEFISELGKLSLYNIYTYLPDLRESYIRIFLKVFKNDEVIEKINEENFYGLRSLILRMNCVKEEKVNPNPEIQAFIEKSKRVKSQNTDDVSFADIISSVVAHTGITYEVINDFTIYQLYMTYYRIAQFKNYDTTTLFATVPTDQKVEIESWSKHINIFEEEKYAIERDEFEGKAKKIFD